MKIPVKFRPVCLPPDVLGRLLLHSMPGRRESWDEFMAQVRAHTVGDVICLTPRDEIKDKSPDYDRAVATGSLPFKLHRLDVSDYELPRDADAFRSGIASVAQRLRDGAVVLMHCAAGIGRTGMAAACVLKQLGVQEADALERVKKAGSQPDTSQQLDFVISF